MADPSMTAYLPLQFIIKQEMSDEHQEDCGEEDNRKLHANLFYYFLFKSYVGHKLTLIMFDI